MLPLTPDLPVSMRPADSGAERERLIDYVIKFARKHGAPPTDHELALAGFNEDLVIAFGGLARYVASAETPPPDPLADTSAKPLADPLADAPTAAELAA